MPPPSMIHKEICDFIPTMLGSGGLEAPFTRGKMFPPGNTAEVTFNLKLQVLSSHCGSILIADQQANMGVPILVGIIDLDHREEIGFPFGSAETCVSLPGVSLDAPVSIFIFAWAVTATMALNGHSHKGLHPLRGDLATQAT